MPFFASSVPPPRREKIRIPFGKRQEVGGLQEIELDSYSLAPDEVGHPPFGALSLGRETLTKSTAMTLASPLVHNGHCASLTMACRCSRHPGRVRGGPGGAVQHRRLDRTSTS
jgi:hypothetical protein